MMVLRNGPNFRPGSKEEEEEEINHLIEAALKVWSESLNQKSREEPLCFTATSTRQRPPLDTVSEDVVEMFEI